MGSKKSGTRQEGKRGKKAKNMPDLPAERSAKAVKGGANAPTLGDASLTVATQVHLSKQALAKAVSEGG